jgi:uncharacterized protein (TIGR02145 family)
MGLFFGQIGAGAVPTPPPVTSNIKYGRLYNGYAAIDPLFAPAGWHVPTLEELNTLITFVGGLTNTSRKFKETGVVYWASPNTNATNELNFNGRGAGSRLPDGSFLVIYEVTAFRTTSSDILSFNLSEDINLNATLDAIGASCRFIKDDSTLVSSVIDYDGNIYRTCKIGNQVWLADNWACTKLNDGTPIPNVTDGTEWAALITGAYCNYDNDLANVFL